MYLLSRYPGVWLEFDVTEDVRNFIDGEYINYGWLISDVNYQQYFQDAWFFSKENGNFKPYLKVKEPGTIYVDDDNTEGPWDGTKEHPYRFIQDGLDNCLRGDTIFVFNGTYHESVIIYQENINLIGESKKDTIILSKNERWAVLVRTEYYGIKISGFTISTDSNNNNGYAGIVLDYNSYDNYVTDNIIVNNTVGILLWGWANNNYILNNTIFFYHNIGIALNQRNFDNIVSNNTIKDVNYGICMEGKSFYNSICYNDISNTDTGIYLSAIDSYNNISNNLLKNTYENTSMS